MAHTTGLGKASSASSRRGNSLMVLRPAALSPDSGVSAPPLNSRPPPVSTTAFTPASFPSLSRAADLAQDRLAERVDRRVVDGGDADVAVARHGNEFAHDES